VSAGHLTARELADRERVSTETILRWTRLGYFEGVAFRLPSGQLRYREDRLEELEEEWATTERGVVTQPAGRRPAGNLTAVTQPNSEED
jgi:predicted site-specific integrase-resolvase